MLNSRLRLLVVDDSSFFRNRIKNILKNAKDIDIVGFAVNGYEALEKAKVLKPDLITMDVWMPGMDGITAVKHIMAESPTRILMLSALTKEGARETLDALEAGAVDFLTKEPDSLSAIISSKNFTDLFIERIRAIICSPQGIRYPQRKDSQKTLSNNKQIGKDKSHSIKLIVIGASTGGPMAVQAVLNSLPIGFSIPILIAIHMPSNFTSAYADRLNSVTSLCVREASDLDILQPGSVLIAPGGKQMTVESVKDKTVVRISDAVSADLYHPSVDRLFTSAASVFNNHVLGIGWFVGPISDA